MEIIIENENAQLSEYKINFKQAKEYLQEELSKYKQLVVTDEFIQMAKKSRAELNAKKKELTDRFRTVKKKHNEPIDKLKVKVDELLNLIEEPLSNIDARIKEYEQKIKEQKQQMIIDIFEENKKNTNVEIDISTIFNPKWLNTDYSKKKITEEISLFFDRVTKDLEVIESFEDEFVIPLKEFYMECFDMSSVMQKKIAFDKAKKAKQLQEAEEQKKKEVEKERIDIFKDYLGEEEIPEAIQDDLSNENDTTLQSVLNQQETIQESQSPLANDLIELSDVSKIENEETSYEYIEFWVRVTPEQKLKMRECVISNHIKCGKLVR